MSTRLAIIFLCVFAVTKAQNGYGRDNPSNKLGYNPFGQAISDEDQSTGDEIPGEAGRDYPAYDKVPDTGFSCNNQQYPGYYADPESQCQAFYICQKSGRGASFLCPTGSIFNQESLVCDWWYNVDCSRAEEQYSVNEQVSRAMEKADARLSEQQEQGGYNYDAPGASGNAAGQYNQEPSSEYGVPSKGNNGNNQNRRNSQHNLSPVYGVPGQTAGSPFSKPQNGAAGQYNQGPSSSYGVPSRGNNGNGYNQNGKNGSPFGQSQNGFNSASSNNGFSVRQSGNRPSQSYGVPSSNRAPSQRYSSSGNFNGNGNSRYSGNGFNGNAPKPVYGPPAALSGPGIQYSNGPRDGNGGNAESFNGFSGNNGNGEAFRNGLGNAPSSVERNYLPPGGTVFSNGNSPSSQYGTPGQLNEGFNGLSGQGNFNGASPDRSYLPSSK